MISKKVTLPEGLTQTPRIPKCPPGTQRHVPCGWERWHWLPGPSWGQREMSRSDTLPTVPSSQNQGRWQPSLLTQKPQVLHTPGECTAASSPGLAWRLSPRTTLECE